MHERCRAMLAQLGHEGVHIPAHSRTTKMPAQHCRVCINPAREIQRLMDDPDPVISKP